MKIIVEDTNEIKSEELDTGDFCIYTNPFNVNELCIKTEDDKFISLENGQIVYIGLGKKVTKIYPKSFEFTKENIDSWE